VQHVKAKIGAMQKTPVGAEQRKYVVEDQGAETLPALESSLG
jgi:hypothetical protein